MNTLSSDVAELQRLKDLYLQLKREEVSLQARTLQLRDATRSIEANVATELINRGYSVGQLVQIDNQIYTVIQLGSTMRALEPVNVTVITEQS